MSSQALASLTATYTDSEDEGDHQSDQESPFNENPSSMHASPVKENNEKSPDGATSAPKLVNYLDDTVVSEEERDKESEGADDSNHSSENEESLALDALLPPPVKKKCNSELQEKIAKLFEKAQRTGCDMNSVIQKRKDFRNPSIYEKLIQFCGIDEQGTNYPAELYDPFKFGEKSYYEELAKVQRADMERREKERKEKSKVDLMLGGALKKPMDEEKKKKSKWDQAAPNASNQMMVKQPGLMQQPQLLTSATGTKSTVISAFGSLPKKKI